MLVKIDDDLAARYDLVAQEYKQPLAQVIERQLARFADYPATLRVVVLSRDPLQQIEQLLGGGQLTTPEQLVARVRDYASITLGKIELDFTPAQKQEIAHRAAKHGKSPKEIVQDLVLQVTNTLFWDTVPTR